MSTAARIKNGHRARPLQSRWVLLFRRAVLIAAGLLPLALGGCRLQEWAHNGYKVGPNYLRPAVAVSSEWIDYEDDRVSTDRPNLATWWTVFNDPTIDELVRTALQQNLDLRGAGARIMEARYRRQIAVGSLFPQQQFLSGSYAAIKQSGSSAFTPPRLWFDNWDNALNVSWELDFWGRYRRSIESADAILDASVENFDNVIVLLLAEVCSSYVEYRSFQQRLVYAHNNVTAQEKSLDMAQNRLKEGVATRRDVEQARTILEQTRALIPAFELGKRVAANRLCVLLGGPPRDLESELGEAPIPEAAPEVAVGIPADLVRRRPDVRQAERELAAQSAQIGIAASDLYPHITLNGNFGVAAEKFGDLFDSPRSLAGAVGPAFRWDVLNYGRLLANVRVQDARFQQLAYAYQQTVLDAGREAEDGITSFLRNQERLKSLTACADAAKNTREITFKQYSEGAADFTAVFIAEAELATRQDQMAASQGDVALSLISLYRALGGGWEIRLMNPSATAAGDSDATESRESVPAIATPEQP
jgi:NodT family efflux transporter outer membrane factor (OMF) lipoprotein